MHIGSAVTVKGILIESQGKQDFELKATDVVLEGDCPDDYPLQAKGRPTREFLREIAYLRPRTNLFSAVFRVRSVAAYAIHKYFQDNGYVYFHAPLITASDCEGAGEMFRVTTLDMENPPFAAWQYCIRPAILCRGRTDCSCNRTPGHCLRTASHRCNDP